ncbi:MAG: hypothetical protein KDE19_17400, partial [Caldilineaceae bacterium]|nr:hypothetical protein [Caldilineaceae bacterium]
TEMPLAEVTMRAVGWVETGTRLAVSTVAAVDKLGEPVTLMGASGLITVTGQPNGDVNCDLQVDQHDVDLILQYDVGLAAMDQHCPPAAQMLFFPQCDVNGDGHCDLRDAQQLRR